MSDRRLSTLTAALGFLQLPPRAPELQLLHRYLDSWHGVAAIVGGLRRMGYETEFRQYPQGWRVNVRRADADPIIGSRLGIGVSRNAWHSPPLTQPLAAI